MRVHGNPDILRASPVLHRQHDLREVVGDIPVIGSLCFVEADWPLIGGAFATRGVQVLWPKRLAKLLIEREGAVEVSGACEALASHFKPA